LLEKVLKESKNKPFLADVFYYLPNTENQPLSPQYRLIISDLQDLHPILHPKNVKLGVFIFISLMRKLINHCMSFWGSVDIS
jgi:hypothetical protein